MWVVDNFNEFKYTSLPNDFLIEKAFIGSKRNLFPFIQMKQNSSIVPETTLHFHYKIKNIFKYVIEHPFFKLGNKTFNQFNRIAMGWEWDPAPFAANISLYSKTSRNDLTHTFGC